MTKTTATRPADDGERHGQLELEPARAPVTSTSLRQIRAPEDEQIHPDGSRAVFVLRDWPSDQPRSVTRIWSIPLNGGSPTAITSGPGNDSHPRWSPDGQQFAFLSTRADGGDDKKDGKQESDGTAQIYLMPASGGTPRRLCAVPNGVESFAWSPDGSQLALLTLEGAAPANDPNVVVPDRHRRLWTVAVTSDQPAPVTPSDLTIWEYEWSPDGKHFAVYYSAGPGETDWYRGQVGKIPAEGGAIRRLTQLTRQAGALTWSPDSSHIAYISGEWSDRGLVGGEVFVIPADGGEPRNLTPGVEFSPSWLRWLPDGKQMLYTGWDGVAHQVGLLDVANGERMPLTRDFIIGGGGWPRLSTTPDLRAMVTHSSDRLHPPDIYAGTLTIAGAARARLEWRQLTHLNALVEETVQLAPAEVVSWESADGWRIEGLFTRPVRTTPGELPPLVVQVHGGPSSAWMTDWRGGVMWGQLCASAGFAVFQPNIRGGMGRGVAFADAVLSDPGGKDLQDVLSGIDYLVKRGLVDGERVAIVGWSYGGFMTAWAISQSRRFKAAMMGAGVCDFHSFHAQTNIPDWDMRILAADPLTQPDVYRAHSAITFAADITTPTLIVHGEQDPCVPVNQAYELHRALLERNVPTELVVYPREGHGFVEREHSRDVDERMIRWLKQYL